MLIDHWIMEVNSSWPAVAVWVTHLYSDTKLMYVLRRVRYGDECLDLVIHEQEHAPRNLANLTQKIRAPAYPVRT